MMRRVSGTQLAMIRVVWPCTRFCYNYPKGGNDCMTCIFDWFLEFKIGEVYTFPYSAIFADGTDGIQRRRRM